MRGRRHAPSCAHCPRVRALGRDFQAWRAAWEAQHELAGHGYRTESAQHAASSPAPTFKAYLIANTGAAWPMSGRQSPRRARFAA